MGTHDQRCDRIYASTTPEVLPTSPALMTDRMSLGQRAGALRSILAAAFVVLILPSAYAQTPPSTETYDLSISKGLIEFGKGHYEEAVQQFERALEAQPDDVDARDYLGQALLRLKKHEEALKIFRQLVEADPSSGKALLGLGIAQTSLGRYEEALNSLKAAESVLPDNPLVYYYQGLVYHQLKAFNQTPALFSRAMALSPDLTPSARYYTGVAHYQLGLLEEAQKEFQEAIASGEPESELARSAREFLEYKGVPPKEPRKWDLSLSMSGQYDTNVVLLPIGTQPSPEIGISRKDDFRTTFYARGEYRPLQTKDWTAGATYGFYQSFQQNLSVFNVEDHSPSLFVMRQIGAVQARFQYVFDYVKVGQSPYLIAHAVQPIVTIAEGGDKLTQFQFRYQNKDFQHGRFAGNSARDGKNWLAGVTQYVFFAEGTGHYRVGYTYDTDRTGGGSPSMATPGDQTNADWAYKAHRISAAVALPPMFTIRPSVAIDYYRQEYDNPNSFSTTGTTRRRDNILFFTGTLGRDLTDSIFIALEYNYTRDQSNISVFDYARSIYSLTLSGRF